MIKNITFEVETFDWECECCGNGEHYQVNIPELNITLSRNDQFGGKLNPDHDDMPGFIEYDMDWTYILMAYCQQGYSVTVKLNQENEEC